VINIKISKQQLMDILGIKKDALIKIEQRQQLHLRLEEKGYKLLDKIKEGRKVYYILEQENELKEVYNNMVKYVYGTDKEKEFSTYFALRTILNNWNICYNIKEIAERSSVSSKTIRKWDSTLIDKDIIARDGYFYFCIINDAENKIYKVEPSNIEEYRSFWRNKAYLGAFKNLQDKYYKGELTLMELQLASADIGAIRQVKECKYYYRVKKFITHKENELYIDTMKLIKKLYGLDKGFNIDFTGIEEIDKEEQINN
jgi:hypothetical protein